MTVAQALRAASERLSKTSETARLDAELLMAEALNMSRSDLLLRGGDLEMPQSFDALVGRRAAHEPVAYILGRQEFYGRAFKVTPEVLIPRSDSEPVVEAALKQCGESGRALDLGTGSGALLLTILAECPGWDGVGIDNSLGALVVARTNAATLDLSARAELHQRSWRDNGWADGLGQFDLVIANPPYVESDAQLAPSVYNFEPHQALFAGPDGLDDYRIIIPLLRDLLAPNGCAVLEIGATQADAVTRLAESEGFAVALVRDLGDRPRALLLQ